MKTPKLPFLIILPATAALALPCANAQEEGDADSATPGPDLTLISSRTIEMKPADKRPLHTKGNERNPYANRTPEEVEVDENEADSEENRIRTRLLSLPVGGASIGNRGLRLLLGDIVLEKGKIVEQLIPDQTEFLKVLEISDKEVKFGWLDVETGELTGKTMQIAYDLSPGVRYFLPGQIRTEETPKRIMGIRKVDIERRRMAAEYEQINPRNRLGASIFEKAQ